MGEPRRALAKLHPMDRRRSTRSYLCETCGRWSAWMLSGRWHYNVNPTGVFRQSKCFAKLVEVSR